MKNKKIVFFILVLSLIVTKTVEAQMATATKIVWDVKISADLNASKGDVWRVITDYDKLPKYSNQYVKSIKKIGEGTAESREVVFTNGNKRSETIEQKDYVNKFMVIRINKESLPEGVKYAEIAIFTKDIDDENSNISWLAKVEGKKLQKQKLMDELEVEFKSYIKGFLNLRS